MGNRATVIFTAGETISPAIYLHWNGGPESIYAFLAELDRRGVRADADYEAARFVQIVGNFFGNDGSGAGLSLGIVSGPGRIDLDELGRVMTDHSDNGFYVVNRYAGTVRRFKNDYSGHGLVEMTPEVVAQERDRAIAHPQYDGVTDEINRVTALLVDEVNA